MKSELRGKYLKKRMEYKNPLSDMIIYNKVIRGIHKYDKVLIYVSKENEVDTINIIKYCLHNNIKVAVPKCNNNEMLFYYIDSLDELSLNKYNILEPNNKRLVRSYKNSICITPSILLDNKGNRIGYGKGFYDKFFNEVDIYKIGLCYKKCLVRKIDVNNFDKRVEKVITD